jgi:hypothetical protein
MMPKKKAVAGAMRSTEMNTCKCNAAMKQHSRQHLKEVAP